jgi:hypothetical protein
MPVIVRHRLRQLIVRVQAATAPRLVALIMGMLQPDPVIVRHRLMA